jgi:hypothetical protein
MSRLRRFKPSGSMLVAVLALVLAMTGSAVAASVITSKQIKDGTIQTKDLAKKTVTALKGKQGSAGLAGPTGAAGPAGVAGPQGGAGAKGDKGDKGDIGPSKTATNYHDAATALANGSCFFFGGSCLIPFPAFTTVETIDVPAAGSYLVQSKVALDASGTTIAWTIGCTLSRAGGGDTTDGGTLVLGTVASSVRQGVLSAMETDTTTGPATYNYSCSKPWGGSANAETVNYSGAKITATLLGSETHTAN